MTPPMAGGTIALLDASETLGDLKRSGRLCRMTRRLFLAIISFIIVSASATAATNAAAAYLERLAVEAGEAGAVYKHHVVFEQLQIFLLFLLARAAPITTENETGDAGNVEICLE